VLGTLVNAAAVVAGSLLGMLIQKRLPQRITRRAFQAIGLFTLFLGVSMALETSNYLIMIFSIVAGSVLGEAMDIDRWVTRFGDWLKRYVNSSQEKFSEGFVTAFLLYCMGSMTILGAIEEGLGDEPNLLLAKSVLDGFSSIALAASLGVGVLFSALPLLIYQGGLTLFAGSLQNVLDTAVITEVTAVGGILLLGLGITILEIKQIRVLNMLPSLLVAGILAAIFL
jgi:uncharacterized membrane protein YqgA involved in biofilm formation